MMHGGHGGRGSSGGPRGYYGGPRGLFPMPFPLFGHWGMMGMGWLLVPFVFFVFAMLLMVSRIGTSVLLFLIVCFLLLILGGIVILIQGQSKSKPKRKRKRDTYDEDNGYDDPFFTEYSDIVEIES